jgi:hypothetical protein
VKSVEHGQVALARHAEECIDAMDPELIDQDLRAGARLLRALTSGCRSNLFGSHVVTFPSGDAL